jgi:hypothetical protein
MKISEILLNQSLNLGEFLSKKPEELVDRQKIE